jgi:ABC-type molybdate transport system ATPase subunit
VAGREIGVRGAAETGERVLVAVRPEDIGLFHPDPDAERSADGNTLSGRVTHVIRMGAAYRITLDCGAPLVARVPRRGYEARPIEEGMVVLASFPSGAAHLIRQGQRS